MAWTNYHLLTNASPGATRNSGTNGDLKTLLKWACLQAGWTIIDETTNAILLLPAAGNGFPLLINHDSAVSGAAQRCLVRGCESGASVGSLTDPFPLTTQVADASSNWLVSNTASTTDRPFIIEVWDSGLLYLSQFNGTAWDGGVYVTAPATRSADTWNTYIGVRNSTSNTSSAWLTQNPIPNGGVGLTGFFARSFDGTVKSSRAMLSAITAQIGGSVVAWPAAGSGPDGEIDSDPIGIACAGSQSTTISSSAIMRRAWLPQFRAPLCDGIGSFDSSTTFANTAYDPTAVFRLINSSTEPFIVLEETNTYRVPTL